MADREKVAASHLVVVGSSAGGIEALSALLGNLHPDIAAAVVLAQHLDPARPSSLPAILARKTALPVVVVERPTRLEDGKVYVVPANHHVVIADGSVTVEGDHGDRPLPSVDLLLSSAARAFGERVVAVILSGAGSDGAAGAVEVKAAGGTVVIQDPETAAHPSMPLALPPTVVDHVAEIGTMGSLVESLVAQAPADEQDEAATANVVAPLLELVSRHTGIDFQAYKPSTILRRLGRRMAVLNVRTLDAYYEHVSSHRDELSELARSFLIKVTEFFRDPEAFEYLKRSVLPSIIDAGRERGNVLRVWSAGCATGEEAYSLAVLVAELLGTELPKWSVRIFATDLDESAVEFARRGLYPANVLRYVTDELKDRYFERAPPGYRVKKMLRQMVIFGQQDLARGAPFPRINLVVCRNLLIYFKPELQQDLLDLFAYSLQQTSGYLFLGKADTARPGRASFDLLNKRWKVYRCVSGPAAAPASAGRAQPLGGVGVRAHVTRGHNMAVAGVDTNVELLQLRRLNDLVLRHLPTGVVLLDRGYRILSLNGTARRLLGIREPVTDHDFLHTVRSLPNAAVRDGLDRALRDKSTHVIEDVAVEGASGEARFVTLHIAPVQPEGGAAETVVVSVVDSTEAVDLRHRLDEGRKEQQRLVEQLGTANARLKRTNDELQEANEELQGANEELLLAQEELQATNEEFEATNEELQATNEELETNNEELQATNEELEATNEELGARTADLQETMRSLALERARLGEIVSHAPFAIVVLRGPGLQVETANETAAAVLGGATVGRSLAEVCLAANLPTVLQGAQEAFRNDRASLIAAGGPGEPTAEGLPMAFAAVPTHDGDGKVFGVVLYAPPPR
jgi:two-component system CheB/CheR fusion protein